MPNCSGCLSCMSCQSCNNGCQVTCKYCQGCDDCESCYSCQAFCETNQLVGSFNFGECISSGEIFISAEAWKSLITYIQNAYNKGTKQPGGSPNLSDDNLNVKKGDSMKAAMYNNIANALNGLGGSTDDSEISNNKARGDQILGSYFEEIQTYSNKWLLKSSQCNSCNTGCQSCDDGCQVTCKSCQGCDGCESCDTSCNGCNDCEGCEGACESHVEPESSDE